MVALTEMNSSHLYNKLSEDEQLISEDSSDQWDERFKEVICTLHYSHKFDDTNDVSTTYLGSYMAKESQEHFQLIIIFLFMVEECQKHIFPMGHL